MIKNLKSVYLRKPRWDMEIFKIRKFDCAIHFSDFESGLTDFQIKQLVLSIQTNRYLGPRFKQCVRIATRENRLFISYINKRIMN